MASTRQLVAVMLTDVVGFTTLTQQNEAAALRLIEDQENLVRPLIRKHRGREIKTLGDGFLTEFESALAATLCAAELQREAFEHNRRTSTTKLELRIGIHVGDVVRRNEDIYGDTVNLVSRITPTAESGGVCVSGPVYEQVRTKVDFAFQPLDAPQLKHVDLPIAIYRMELPWLSKSPRGLSPWVGREAELDAFRQRIDATQRGEGGVLVLSGEVGMGKSRLGEEGVKHALRNGFRVLRGRALPRDLGFPYSHWADAVREFLRTAPPQLVYKVCGTYGAEIVRLVPETTDVIGAAPPSPALAPEQVQFHFFQAITQFFENVSKEAPLLLFFDDLPWADPASLRLLQHAAPRWSGSRLLIVGAFADSEVDRAGPFQEVLHALHRDHLLSRIRLNPLDPSAIEVLVTGLLGERPSGALTTFLQETSGGNPFYLEELLRSLVEEGVVFHRESGGWDRKPAADADLPTSIREIAERRLHRLEPEDQGLLSIGAVLGVEFEPGLLAQVAGVDETALVEPLERMLRAQVVRERALSETAVAYVFTDAQLRRLLYDNLSFLRRRGYHHKAGLALETGLRGKADDRAGELEYHFLRGNDPGRALEYALRAGERALQLYSHEEALRHLRTALELLESTPDDPRRPGLLEKVSGEEFELSRTEAAIRALQEAAEGFERGGERTKSAELFCELAMWVRFWQHDASASLAWLDRARSILEGQPEGRELAVLYLDTAVFLGHEGRTSEAAAMQSKGRDLADRLGDHELALQIELARADEAPVRQRKEVFDRLRRAEEMAVQYKLAEWIPHVYFAFGLNTLEIYGDVNAAFDWFTKCIDAARRLSNVPFDAGVRRHMFAYVAIKKGNLGEAARLTDELFEFLKETFPFPPPQHLCALSEIAFLRGKFDRATELLGLFDAHPPETIGDYCRMRTRNVKGRLALAMGDAPGAQRAFLLTLELFHRGGETAHTAALGAEALAGLVEARLRLGELEPARTALAELAVLAEAFDEPIGFGYWNLARGLVAAHQGEREEAETAFRRSADAWRTMGWRYHLALSLEEVGRILVRSGNSAEGSARLNEALDMFLEMGAGHDVDRARTLVNASLPQLER